MVGRVIVVEMVAVDRSFIEGGEGVGAVWYV